MYLKQQIFFVMGLSRSGKAVAEFLLSHGATVYMYDDLANDRIEQTMRDLQQKGAKRIKREDLPTMSEICDALVISPGIPVDHPIALAFKRVGRAVIGETEIAARYIKSNWIAVTGTNGKTTTVSMLAEVLQKGGLTAYSCGNIGAPLVGFSAMSEDAVAVAEISSFQLETLNSHRPHVAMVLNITEDHLNRHYNMENYVFLKAKLLKNLSATEYAVLNYDDEIVRSFAEKTKAQVLYFSVRERVKGAFYEQGNLYFGKEKIMAASELPSEGLHNVQNALAVIVAAKIMGIKTVDIVDALTNFKGIKHRIELVREVNGVQYINDSKGTNVDATLKAIATMKRETILLLGGQNKGYDYGKLFAGLQNSKVVHTVLYGENRFALLKSARAYDFNALTMCEDFDFAVRVAFMLGKSGQAILLSPASASFDAFAGYEERGDRFVEIVNAFEETCADGASSSESDEEETAGDERYEEESE